MKNRQKPLLFTILLIIVFSTLSLNTAEAKPGPRMVSMRFVRTEIPIVLASLAAQVGFDVVIASGVEELIDLNLTDVDWETALGTIITTGGLSCHWNGDVLIVLSTQGQDRGELSHRIVHLKYADPGAVKDALVNTLSGRGKIEILGSSSGTGGNRETAHASVLVLSELNYRLPLILELIDSLDVPRPQFEIAVKFVETDLDDQSGYGFNWPTMVSASVGGLSPTGEISAGTAGQTKEMAATYSIPNGKIWRLGTLSIDQLNGFIEFLQQKGHSRLLSDPRVSVLENQTAEMRVTTTFPVQTLNRFSEGAIIQDVVDFQDIEVGLTLSVTPRLNDSNKITLVVEPVMEEITGFTGPPDNQRPITANRTVKTTIRVGNNETIVIGGLIRETEFATKSRVFLLGNIPLLGALFTHNKIEKKKTDLLIFITPRILADTSNP